MKFKDYYKVLELEDNKVTIRDRDTMEQIRIPIDEVEKYIEEKVEF